MYIYTAALVSTSFFLAAPSFSVYLPFPSQARVQGVPAAIEVIPETRPLDDQSACALAQRDAASDQLLPLGAAALR